MNKLFLVLVIVLIGCKTQQSNNDEISKKESLKTIIIVNNCINDRIVIFNKGLQCNSGAKVSSYLFQGELVYVFKEGPCTADMHEPVLDKNCKELGLLGGFLGNTMINEISFTEAIFQEIVWEQVPKK